MRFHQLRDWIINQIDIKKSFRYVYIWYIFSLMVTTRKHSLNYAAALSGLNKSQFSKMLSVNKGVAAFTLESLSKKQAKRLAKFNKKFKKLQLRWPIAIIIDATLQNRSSMKTDNVQKFNHGQGYVIGHQWTNIVLCINDFIIPLPPIPFYSKAYCKANKMTYATEHDRLVEYLKKLDLEDYIGPHISTDVIVLADSGYDCKKIQNTILEKKWHFIIALTNTRTVKSEAKFDQTPKSSDWDQIEQFFKDQRRLAWQTIRIITGGPKKKRLEYRIRHTIGFLKGVGKTQLVCSEFKKRPKGRRKYLACSDLKVQSRQIIIGYRLRWKIEVFHKHIKMHLGFEDVAAKYFRSVEAHVHFVYCAYILLHSEPPGVPENAKTIIEKQHYIQIILDNKETAHDLQLATQIGGFEKLKNKFKNKLNSAVDIIK